MPDISDEEYAQLQTAKKFIEAAEGTEGGRKAIMGLAKKINPKVRTEEDVAEEYLTPVKAELKEFRDWKNGMEKQIGDYNVDESLKEIRKTYGYTDEGVESLRKFADENGIKNMRHAAAAFERENPPKAVTPSFASDSFRVTDLMEGSNKDEELKQIRENPQKYENEQIRKWKEDRAKGVFAA